MAGWVDCGVKNNVHLTRKDIPGGLPAISRGRIDFGSQYLPEEIMDYIIDLDKKLKYDEMFESGNVLYPFTERMTIAHSIFKKQMGTTSRDMVHLTYWDQVRLTGSCE